MIRCPHCNMLNRAGARHCGSCGRLLVEADPEHKPPFKAPKLPVYPRQAEPEVPARVEEERRIIQRPAGDQREESEPLRRTMYGMPAIVESGQTPALPVGRAPDAVSSSKPKAGTVFGMPAVFESSPTPALPVERGPDAVSSSKPKVGTILGMPAISQAVPAPGQPAPRVPGRHLPSVPEPVAFNPKETLFGMPAIRAVREDLPESDLPRQTKPLVSSPKTESGNAAAFHARSADNGYPAAIPEASGDRAAVPPPPSGAIPTETEHVARPASRTLFGMQAAELGLGFLTEDGSGGLEESAWASIVGRRAGPSPEQPSEHAVPRLSPVIEEERAVPGPLGSQIGARTILGMADIADLSQEGVPGTRVSDKPSLPQRRVQMPETWLGAYEEKGHPSIPAMHENVEDGAGSNEDYQAFDWRPPSGIKHIVRDHPFTDVPSHGQEAWQADAAQVRRLEPAPGREVGHTRPSVAQPLGGQSSDDDGEAVTAPHAVVPYESVLDTERKQPARPAADLQAYELLDQLGREMEPLELDVAEVFPFGDLDHERRDMEPMGSDLDGLDTVGEAPSTATWMPPVGRFEREVRLPDVSGALPQGRPLVDTAHEALPGELHAPVWARPTPGAGAVEAPGRVTLPGAGAVEVPGRAALPSSGTADAPRAVSAQVTRRPSARLLDDLSPLPEIEVEPLLVEIPAQATQRIAVARMPILWRSRAETALLLAAGLCLIGSIFLPIGWSGWDRLSGGTYLWQDIAPAALGLIALIFACPRRSPTAVSVILGAVGLCLAAVNYVEVRPFLFNLRGEALAQVVLLAAGCVLLFALGLVSLVGSTRHRQR